MLPPSYLIAAHNASPCWLAIATVADSSSQRLRADSSYADSAAATTAGARTAPTVSTRAREEGWPGCCGRLATPATCTKFSLAHRHTGLVVG